MKKIIMGVAAAAITMVVTTGCGSTSVKPSKPISKPKNLTEKEQIIKVQENAYSIVNIEKPSEKVQLATLAENPFYIGSIKNPSEEMQLIAVQENGYAIGNIKNPSEKVQLAAYKQNFNSYQKIKNKTKKIILLEEERIRKDLEEFMKGYLESENEQ